ncbi:MAG: hypothetical protein KDB27_22680, partial [Planctomycetales bacterium]|nr:hypothetical protein [Planctomycetales bacterium]
DVARHRATELRQANDDFDTMIASIESSFEQDKTIAHENHKKFLLRCQEDGQKLNDAMDSAKAIFFKRRCRVDSDDIQRDPQSATAIEHLTECHNVTRFTQTSAALVKSRLASRYIDEGWSVLQFLFLALAATAVAWKLAHLSFPVAAACGGAIALISSLVTSFIVGRIAHNATLKLVPDLNQQLGVGRASLLCASTASKAETAQTVEELKLRRQTQITETTRERDQQLVDAEQRYQQRCAKLERLFATRQQELEETWNSETATIRGHYGPLIETTNANAERKGKELQGEFETKQNKRKQAFDAAQKDLCTRWSTTLGDFQSMSVQLSDFCAEHFTPYHSIDWDQWSASGLSLRSIQIGDMTIAARALSDEIPTSPELVPCPESFSIPAMLTFPEQPSLVLNADGDGRNEGIHVIQNAMLRLLTSLPPGKVRFTIIDPIGLGQNFSAFMHLADFDERLVTNRIWTETSHINQRLGDLTEHMENVIQKYLRNEFASIHEYNEHAGEVSEPFHILVIANFPANFSDETARRLVSIANSGPKCGVYTLLSRDTRLALPRSFDPGDIERNANTLNWNGERFVWQDEEMSDFDVQLHLARDEQITTAILKAVGRQAEDSKRVEVPFANVVPAQEEYWTHSCSTELSVALGRAGATRSQNLNLGVGTSQHVLISGKTGSGKSTLLHALITNAALHYSPDELEFYLIDFKKGVEFKPYADFQLPHARVIAIESEREFGMSVLQRLDQELRERGDLFRDAGVQSLKAFREARPNVRMPRILFIVDEFQEFFVNDDKIAHDASLLLDRLVRQGRAFGMHVILGSQTLAGAYSLARSTIGQMAIRIALQCSAADAHLILSEDNTAARLLSRPGEAIYNDANGMFEGNNLFQVVWLTDSEREKYLKKLKGLSNEYRIETPPPIVFEGNTTADPRLNEQLQECLESTPDNTRVAANAWLGAAIAIKDPTSAVFRRQHGSNLLVVGQRDELANGMLSSAVISLAAARGVRSDGSNRHSVRFAILDGARSETEHTDFGDRLASFLPLDIEVAGPNRAVQAITAIADELNRRNQSTEHAFEPYYLLIYDIARFRALQHSDDFGFSGFGNDSKDDAASTLVSILTDGPPVGIHTIIWADSYNNVNRWFPRQAMRDFGMRVLFQMSAVDSSNLMDSAAASHLSPHRALFYSDERGESEKFRPYGIVSDEWLEQVSRFLSARAGNFPVQNDRQID